MRLLLDTNILIDFYARREPFFQHLKPLLIMEAVSDVELWSSAKSYTDVFYVLRREVPPVQLQRMFKESFQRIKPCTIDEPMLDLACKREWNDFEDCLIAVCAERIRADFIITRDVSGFVQSRITAMSPEGFLDLIEREYGFRYADLAL